IILSYSTPLRTYQGKGFYLLKNKINSTLLNKILALTFFAGGIFTIFLINYLKIDSIFTPISLILIGIMIICGIGTLALTMGSANRYNFSLNSASLVVALALAFDHNEEYAFILTDCEYTNHLGDQMVVEALPQSIKKRKIIHLSGLANGEAIHIIARQPQIKDLSKEIIVKTKQIIVSNEQLSNHSLLYYPSGYSIAGGYFKDQDIILPKAASKQDVSYDEVYIKEVIALIKSMNIEL
ncbi:MAG: hypothetical protein ACRCTA_03695, partial [Bacilli bacterium]